MDIRNMSYDEFVYHCKQSKRIVPCLKSYGGKFYRLVVLKSECDYSLRKRSEKGSMNDEKLENNLIRAKSRVFELALCNDWDWFVTLTLDSKKYDRYNLKGYIKDLSQFVRNQRRIKGSEMQYLLVPEQHKDGAWHLHGFMKGIPEKDIVTNGNRSREGEEYVHWLPYFKKFGYMSMGKIQDDVKASFYMRKYITKTMMKNNFDLGVHSYYASQGLNGADELKSIGLLKMEDYARFDFAYESRFCDVYNLSAEQAQKMLYEMEGWDYVID